MKKRGISCAGVSAWFSVVRLITVLFLFQGLLFLAPVGAQSQQENPSDDTGWIKKIQKIFIPSEQCKQCHDRHYEEWKGMREQTPDLKTFGRVDGALLHGTALTSPVFRTVLGFWLQHNPSEEQRTHCLSCHAPAVVVFPQYTDRIISQVLAGRKHVKVEGIGCSSCHLIDGTKENSHSPPTFHIEPGATLFGPYFDPDENLVHPSKQSDVYRGANYCASCHFSKVKDVMSQNLPGEILKGTICQDCHMEQSTGSSTSQRGALNRPIGRHWFQGIVIPGIMLSNRNLQAEWFPRVDIEAQRGNGSVEGTVVVRNGSLPHMFPGGDPVLKQFFMTITIKDPAGEVLQEKRHQYGRSFEELLNGPIPLPYVSGGMTRRTPFSFTIPKEISSVRIEAVLMYSLIPKPSPESMKQYLSTLPKEKDRKVAIKIIDDYSSPRLLTFRTKTIS